MAIIEPFYVAGGFALYLNRRTALEGWDLEVALRRMGERAQAASRSVDVARAAALALALAGLLALQRPPTAMRRTRLPAAPKPRTQRRHSRVHRQPRR